MIYHTLHEPNVRTPKPIHLSCQPFGSKAICGTQQIVLQKLIRLRLIDLSIATKIYPNPFSNMY